MKFDIHRKRALLATAISSALGITLYVPSTLAVLPQIQTGYGYSLALRDDGVLFQYSNIPLIPINLGSSYPSPYNPSTVVSTNINSISLGSNASGSSAIAAIAANGSLMCWSPIGSNGGYYYDSITTTPTVCFAINGEIPKQVVSNYNNTYYVLTENGKVFKLDQVFGQFSSPVQLPINETVTKIGNIWGNIYFLSQNGTTSSIWTTNYGKLTSPEPISDIKGNYALAQSGNVYRIDYWNSTNPFTQISVPPIKFFPKDSYSGIGIGAGTNEGRLFSFEGSCPQNIGISNVIDARGDHWNGIALTGGNGTDTGKIFSYQCNWSWGFYSYSISEIPNLSNVKEIKGNSWSFNALTNDGRVFFVENRNPIQVGGISDATLISDPSVGHSLIMRRDGTLCGFGNNNQNQLSGISGVASSNGYYPPSSPICGIEDLIVNTTTTSCIAEYKPQEPRTVSIRAVDIPILNDITGKESGRYLTCKGDLALLRGSMDLTVKGETFSCNPVPTLGNITNARYRYADNTLHVPCVSIPTTIRLPAGILISGPTEYYSATLQLLPTDANYGVFQVRDFTPISSP